MELKPKVSIITVNRNNKKGLKLSIESVLKQNFPAYEFLVIDGNSDDGSKELLEQYNGQIHYQVSEADTGIFHAMNKGIIASKGDYLLFLNSGDYLLDEHILQRVFKLNRAEDLLYADSKRLAFGTNIPYIEKEPDELTLYRLYSFSICHQATFIKRNLFDKYGLYNEQNRIASDWEFNIKAIILGDATTYHLNFPTVFYDNTGISITEMESSFLERDRIQNSLIPKRIIKDYENFLELENDYTQFKKNKWIKLLRKLSLVK